ncbi:MAG: HNH endonuclease signature motif containing protein [Bdellovibrionota bacterium]
MPAPVRVTSKGPASRYIEASVRHALYVRDRGRCCNCGSTRNIEIDHLMPFALGGSSDLENLRLVCRSCNQRSAIEVYGVRKMESYLKEPLTPYRAKKYSLRSIRKCPTRRAQSG